MSRYSNRLVAVNDKEQYKKLLDERGVKNIQYYVTPQFKRLTEEQVDSISYTRHVWTVGDRFWKLAEMHYNNKNLWWVIARFNNKPTEGLITPGDEIRIPTDLTLARELLA